MIESINMGFNELRRMAVDENIEHVVVSMISDGFILVFVPQHETTCESIFMVIKNSKNITSYMFNSSDLAYVLARYRIKEYIFNENSIDLAKTISCEYVHDNDFRWTYSRITRGWIMQNGWLAIPDFSSSERTRGDLLFINDHGDFAIMRDTISSIEADFDEAYNYSIQEALILGLEKLYERYSVNNQDHELRISQSPEGWYMSVFLLPPIPGGDYGVTITDHGDVGIMPMF